MCGTTVTQVTEVPLPVNITSSTGTVTYITLSAVNTTGKPGNLTVLQVHTNFPTAEATISWQQPSPAPASHLTRPSCDLPCSWRPVSYSRGLDVISDPEICLIPQAPPLTTSNETLIAIIAHDDIVNVERLIAVFSPAEAIVFYNK